MDRNENMSFNFKPFSITSGSVMYRASMGKDKSTSNKHESSNRSRSFGDKRLEELYDQLDQEGEAPSAPASRPSASASAPPSSSPTFKWKRQCQPGDLYFKLEEFFQADLEKIFGRDTHVCDCKKLSYEMTAAWRQTSFSPEQELIPNQFNAFIKPHI